MHPMLVPAAAPLAHASRRSRPTGLVPGTMVETAEGPMPVEFLLAGDIILTETGPVELRGTSVVEARGVEMVVFAAGALPGLTRELAVPRSQMVLVHDWRAMILYGREAMLTPAASLIDGAKVRGEVRVRQRLVRLHFDAPQVVRANGVALGSARSAVPAVQAKRLLH